MPRLFESSAIPLVKESNKILKGTFAEFDKLNQNDRIYPKNVYLEALDELLPKIREGRLLGECDHPEYDEVHLSNVSHIVKRCEVQGDKLYGEVELLDTPSGKVAQALVEAGVPIGISSRAIGNTRNIKEGTEVTDLKLITFDLVADPSFSNAVLTESAKTNLNNSLNTIERSLPLNEAYGENSSVRDNINRIRTSINKKTDIVKKLVESAGSISKENIFISGKLKESTTRNVSLRSKMLILQEKFNLQKMKLDESTSKASIYRKFYANKCSNIKRIYEARILNLKKSYTSKLKESVRAKDEEIINLRKELCIEKRGLTKDSVLPLLEGLRYQKDMDAKLDSVKHLGSRHYKNSISAEDLIEGLKQKPKGSGLSKIISRV